MPRTQSERSATTQAALISAARKLWGERGYAEAGTSEIAEAAGVTRGAMYHQYADKAALFYAVIDTVLTEAMQRLSAAVEAAEPASPAAALQIAADAWLQIATDPEISRLVLLEAPAVLGGAEFRELHQRYGLGMTEQLLASAIEAGELHAQPVRPLAAVLLAAIDEASMVIADAADSATAQAEVTAVVRDLLDGVLRSDAVAQSSRSRSRSRSRSLRA
jgi:AcrR family transcriptional regulator